MSLNILLVEDDDGVQRLLLDFLQGEGFTVVAEKDGDWALKALQRRSFDLVILDVVLPGINGFDVAERMREQGHGRQVPLIMMSGIYKGHRHREDATQRYKLTAYLDKPLDLAALSEVLQSCFGKRYPKPSDADKQRKKLDASVSAERLADKRSHAEKKEVERSAKADFSGSGVSRGALKATPFAELLAQIYRWRSTGALLLKNQKIKKIVYFKDGYPTYIKSNVLAECLGKVMVRERLIGADECEESLAQMKRTKRQQGTVLIEMGCISPHNLVYALELQLQTKLYDIFAWADGDYQFNPKAELPSEIVELDQTPATIIYEGIKRAYKVPRLRGALAPYLASFLVVHPDPLQRFQDMDLSRSERRLVALIDGKKTLAQILDKELLPRDKAMGLCYALIAAQMVEAKGKRAPKSERIEPPPLVQKTKRPSPTAAVPPLPSKHSARVAKDDGEDFPPALPQGAAPPPPPRSRSARPQGSRGELALKAKEMRGMNYFEILGVSRSASSDEIKMAYLALTRTYHPDKNYAKATADLRTLADQIFSMVHTAYEVLSNVASRQAYESDLHQGSQDAGLDDVARILGAESKFQRGAGFLKKRRYDKAAEAFREAVELYGDEGEFHAYLGWSLFQNDPNNLAVQRQAEDLIEKGIGLNPRVDQSYVFLGYLYKATKRGGEAEAQFEKAIRCNPDCTEALTELRLIEKSRGRSNVGILRSLT